MAGLPRSDSYSRGMPLTLHVWTASLRTRDPDALNITRKSGVGAFAPSWVVLGAALKRRREGATLSDEEWKEAYAKPYLREMVASMDRQPDVWEALLARKRVVLTCYCPSPERCHRTLLGRFLVRHGAVFHGELA